MHIAKNTTHNLRHHWLNVAANKNAASVSLLAHRTEICVDVTIGTTRHMAYWKPEQLAAVLAEAIMREDAAENKS